MSVYSRGVNSPLLPIPLHRDVALEMLSQQDIGSFLVRDSTTHPGCYALSVKVPKYDNPVGISHYLITRTPQNTVRFKVGCCSHPCRFWQLCVFHCLLSVCSFVSNITVKVIS